MDTYTIKTDHFEGPFDLLLFFIERDELDIYDIPIARITDAFLAHIRELEALNLDVASEFILVAATLMRIKAKLLLPRRELDEQGVEIDPRAELVERLLEYKRYKAVLEELRALEQDRLMREARGNATGELGHLAGRAKAEAELESLTPFRLLKAFERVMGAFEDRAKRVVHTVARFPYTIEGQREYVLGQVRGGGKADFARLFSECENRMQAIFTFLALLELLQQGLLQAVFGEAPNQIWVEPQTEPEP
jgi:segregation and condensation protein A